MPRSRQRFSPAKKEKTLEQEETEATERRRRKWLRGTPVWKQHVFLLWFLLCSLCFLLFKVFSSGRSNVQVNG
jgi:hypothetical protein